jgi:hypothetical protein
MLVVAPSRASLKPLNAFVPRSRLAHDSPRGTTAAGRTAPDSVVGWHSSEAVRARAFVHRNHRQRRDDPNELPE